MTAYEMTLLTKHVDEEMTDWLIDAFDAMVSRDHNGQVYVTLAERGTTFATAAKSALTALHLNGVYPVRFVPDLLTKADIAERLGVSRQAVQNWVTGARRGAFPAPVNPVSGGVWYWTDVYQWAFDAEKLKHDGTSYPTLAELDLMNAYLGSGMILAWPGSQPVTRPTSWEKEIVVRSVEATAFRSSRQISTDKVRTA